MKLSLVLATNGKKELLNRALQSIANQVIFEIIVINNNVNKINNLIQGTINVKVVNTDIVGLAHARNVGWQIAKGEYVAFIDDDAVAEPNWVESILSFIKLHPDVEAFGGPYKALNDKEIPSWIPDEVVSKELPITKARQILQPSEWLNGTNMIFSKNALKEMGGFSEDLGVKGNKRAYGEETDLQIRLSNAGYEIWYDPKIKVKHEFMKFKQNMWFILKDQYLHGKGSVATFRHLKKAEPGKTANRLFSKVISPKISLKRRIYYFFSPLFYLAGMIRAHMG